MTEGLFSRSISCSPRFTTLCQSLRRFRASSLYTSEPFFEVAQGILFVVVWRSSATLFNPSGAHAPAPFTQGSRFFSSQGASFEPRDCRAVFVYKKARRRAPRAFFLSYSSGETVFSSRVPLLRIRNGRCSAYSSGETVFSSRVPLLRIRNGRCSAYFPCRMFLALPLQNVLNTCPLAQGDPCWSTA